MSRSGHGRMKWKASTGPPSSTVPSAGDRCIRIAAKLTSLWRLRPNFCEEPSSAGASRIEIASGALFSVLAPTAPTARPSFSGKEEPPESGRVARGRVLHRTSVERSVKTRAVSDSVINGWRLERSRLSRSSIKTLGPEWRYARSASIAILAMSPQRIIRSGI